MSMSPGRAIVMIAAWLLLACASPTRPQPPPAGEVYRLPWGAVPADTGNREAGDDFQERLAASLRTRIQELRARDPGARLPYRVLSISGGGSRGAYGAGVLTGWSESGQRPEFDVVTGISTGALMATHAFLGSEHDDGLRLYTKISDADIYEPRGRLAILRSDAVFDTAPLRRLVAETLDEATLDLVARENAKGRRLFIGTTNLDANSFVVWDMGAIAASGRPDRLQRYRDVVLASASFPVSFPPVYIPVEADGQRYYQMHVDGGVRETVFFFDFVDDYRAALAELGLRREDVHPELFLLNNDALYAPGTYKPVSGSLLSISGATIGSLMRKATLGSLYRVWVLALIAGADFHISYIPPDFDLSDNSLRFDTEEMKRLFELGRSRAQRGEAWSTQRAPTTLEELAPLIDPRRSVDRLEARPWLGGDDE
jgi:hypothetical protein